MRRGRLYIPHLVGLLPISMRQTGMNNAFQNDVPFRYKFTYCQTLLTCSKMKTYPYNTYQESKFHTFSVEVVDLGTITSLKTGAG